MRPRRQPDAAMRTEPAMPMALIGARSETGARESATGVIVTSLPT